MNETRVSDYVPEYNGNRELPEQDRIKVSVMSLSYAQTARIVRNAGNSEVDSDVEVVKNNVLTIHGYSVDGVAITGGEKLLELGSWKLILEIVREIYKRSNLTADEVKN